MGVKVSNNAFGTISAGISSSATTVTLDSGQGARFPTLGGSDHFYGTLIDTSNNVEIIKVTARSTDSMTVVRAQDNTTARAFAIGDRFELRPVAKLFEDILSEAVPAADTIVNSMIATDAVNADSIAADAVGSSEIAANAVGASELNVSGNGTSGQALLSDGDGTMSWGSAGGLIKTTQALFTTSRVSTSFNQTSISSENFAHPSNGKQSFSFTKDQASTKIVIHFHFSVHYGSQTHVAAMWKDTSSLFRRFGFDLARNGQGAKVLSGVLYYSASDLGAGTHNFHFSLGRSNDANISYIINPNTNDNGDMSGATTSSVVVYEVT